MISNPTFLHALLTATAMAAACAVLSVPVVLRRWALVGEGIGHSGFGGAGTAWLLAVFFPALDNNLTPYVAVILFSLATAVAIGWLSRRQRVHIDAAIGIFLVGSLAWGFIAQHVYAQHFGGRSPAWFDTLLFGEMTDLSGPAALSGAAICAAVVIVIVALGKEILAYCFDPTTAYAGGVRSGFIHYLLMVLIAIVIVIGMRVAGSVLVTALLVLPGTTALLLSRRLGGVIAVSVICGVLGAIGGLLVHARWGFLPVGPAIVLVLMAEFVAGYLIGAARQVT